VKFVHAADLHIDSPLRGLQRYPGAPHERIRSATRRAFSALVDGCLAEQVDALVLAGDIFDRDWRDYNTGLFFVSELSRLREIGTQVLMVRGNHDAKSTITKNLRLPEHVHEFSSRKAETVRVAGLAFHGRSFADARVTEDLSLSYPEPEPDAFNVGILHTSLDGRTGHEPYAPTTATVLAAKGYQYWALGHVHTREVVRQTPHIVFPGNLQGRHARELGPKGALLVHVPEDRTAEVRLEARDLDILRWSLLTVDASDAETMMDLVDKTRETLRDVLSGDVLHAVRLVYRGRTRLRHELQNDQLRFRSELRAALTQEGDIWLEKIVIASEAAVDLAAFAARDDAPGHLARYLLQGGSGSALAQDVEDSWLAVKRELPTSLHDALDVPELQNEVRDLLLARLLSSSAEEL
jgi:DNA repair protein SbcD/Mre11